MKILVIGNGFIGKSIILKLESEGHEILVFSRSPKEGISSRQVLGDIFDFSTSIKVLKWNPQIIIHTAWITTPGIYRNDPSNHRFSQFTISLTENILHSEVEHLLVLGTCAEYGHQNLASSAGITPLSPNTLYAEQKAVTFNSINHLLQESKIRFTWARIFYPYGPFQDEKRLIPYLVRAIKNGSPINLADTSSIYDWISIRDIASAISWIISNETVTELDVGTSFGYTNLELLATLLELLPNGRVQEQYGPHKVGAREVFVTAKDSPLLKSGWLPNDSLRSGLEWAVGS